VISLKFSAGEIMDMSLLRSAGWKRKFKQSAPIEDNTPFYSWIYTVLSKCQLFPTFLSFFCVVTDFLSPSELLSEQVFSTAGEISRSSPCYSMHRYSFQAAKRINKVTRGTRHTRWLKLNEQTGLSLYLLFQESVTAIPISKDLL